MQQDPHGEDMDSLDTAQIFHKYYVALVGYACKFVDQQTAEDLVQDVFIQTYNKIPVNARSYLFRSVHNKCQDHFKHLEVHRKYMNEARILQDELTYFHPDTGNKTMLEEESTNVWNAIEQLPPKCREIVKLRYQQGLKTVEISDAMGISSRTVETQLYKGIRQLRSMIKKLNYLLSILF